MHQVTIKPTNGQPNVRFTGELKATVNSRRRNSVRWTVLNAYETEGGSIVIEEVGETEVPGEERFVEVRVFKSIEDMTKKMGLSRLTGRLYQKLNIGTVDIA